ncbi:hypothetical protein ACTXT7_014557 [Hymenolepis weldensis]
MWQFMSSHKGVMINNAAQAIEKVKKGGYAYILESTMNEYYTQRNCDLTQIGNNLDSKGYGIGFPQGSKAVNAHFRYSTPQEFEVVEKKEREKYGFGSKYRDAFSVEILKLQALQNLEQIRLKWWRNFNITQNCSEKASKSKDTSSLGLEQVGGCFVMILIGLGASVIISLQEFLYKVYHRAQITKVQVVH